MNLFFEILLFFCLALLLHSYVLFPFILSVAAKRRKEIKPPYPDDEALPFVSVVMAAYNEEKVLRRKIESVFNTDYPLSKLELVIGSDNSTDATDAIIQDFIARGYAIQFTRFGGRSGKSHIINALVPLAKGEILILTDANIFFTPDLIRNLIRHFADAQIALAGANIVNSGMRNDGISYQEQTYIQRENLIKYREGLLWGTMMGAFGACYALRKKNYAPVPPNFFMEDFYLTMHVLSQGYKAINDLGAIAYEDVSNLLHEEFKRKVRISAGNFQNLAVYKRLLLPLYRPLGFCFFSHKFIRWTGPFILLVMLIANAFLLQQNLFFTILFLMQAAGLFTPLLDWCMKKLNIHTFAIRLVAYFYTMNLALLIGFLKYLKGIRSSVWEPTIRNIETNT